LAQQRYERMGSAFHARLRDGFRAIAQEEPERCAMIDAARPIDAVAADVKAAVIRQFGVKL
jgi:dTMP kinase